MRKNFGFRGFQLKKWEKNVQIGWTKRVNIFAAICEENSF